MSYITYKRKSFQGAWIITGILEAKKKQCAENMKEMCKKCAKIFIIYCKIKIIMI